MLLLQVNFVIVALEKGFRRLASKRPNQRSRGSFDTTRVTSQIMGSAQSYEMIVNNLKTHSNDLLSFASI